MQGQQSGRHSRWQIGYGNQPPDLPKILAAMENCPPVRRRGRFTRTHDVRAIIMNTVGTYERGSADDLARTLRDAGVLIPDSSQLWFDPKRAQHVIECYNKKSSLDPVDPGRLQDLKQVFSGPLAPRDTGDEEAPVAVAPQYVIYLTPAQHRLWKKIDAHLDLPDTDGLVPRGIARGRPFRDLCSKGLLLEAPDNPGRFMPAFELLRFRVLSIKQQKRLKVSAPVMSVIRNVELQQWIPPHDGQGCEASFIRWVERDQVRNVPGGVSLDSRDLRDKFFCLPEEDGWGIVVHQPDLTRPLICWSGAEPFRFVQEDEVVEENLDDPDTTSGSVDPGPSLDELSPDTSSDVDEASAPEEISPEQGGSDALDVSEASESDPPASFAGPLAHLQMHEADGIQSLTEDDLNVTEASWRTTLEIARGQLALVAQERKRREEVRRAEAERQRKIAAARARQEELAARRASLEAQLAAIAAEVEEAELEVLELTTS